LIVFGVIARFAIETACGGWELGVPVAFVIALATPREQHEPGVLEVPNQVANLPWHRRVFSRAELVLHGNMTAKWMGHGKYLTRRPIGHPVARIMNVM
jgi:hypothetical protein